ncbi:MAG: glutathione S-transferase N-terminal domain-containing protein [Polyangiaceae bacterium]
MIKLFTWTTPNGIKPIILLEELGLDYETQWVDIGKGDQHEPAYLAVNPNGKIPALQDGDLTVFESGAILIHLAEKHGKFLPKSGQARLDALEWLFFQVGGIGPMFGQLGHFKRAKEQVPYALDRYTKESERLYGVLDARLSHVEYLAGEYGIADMATWGWANSSDHTGIDVAAFPNVKKWLARVGERPAVKRAAAKKPG